MKEMASEKRFGMTFTGWRRLSLTLKDTESPRSFA